MYSVFNVDVSAKQSTFRNKLLLYPQDYKYFEYSQQAIIRGSSTVNGDSAHDSDPLAKEHNYVSFYVKSIKIRYDITTYNFGNVYYQVNVPCYVVLFKFPYESDEDIRSKIGPARGDIKDTILYSHPECVLSYDLIAVEVDKNEKLVSSGFLNCNKPFIVGPNDYVGVLYYCLHYTNIEHLIYNVEATAKVIFKPQ